MIGKDASGAKSADGVEGPRAPAQSATASASGGKKPPAARRASQQTKAGAHRSLKRKTKPRAKATPALLDTLGRPFPPPPAEVKSAGGKPVDKGGRPYAIKDVAHAISTLEGLGAIMATSKECAAVLKINEATLFAFFKRFPEAREAWAGGKEQGKASLRRSQFKLAEKNATMGIFLGMQYLDQKDKRAFSGDPDNPIKHQHAGTVTAKVKPDYSSVPLDELVRLHAAGVGKPQG